jgi:hypothetical protein
MADSPELKRAFDLFAQALFSAPGPAPADSAEVKDPEPRTITADSNSGFAILTGDSNFPLHSSPSVDQSARTPLPNASSSESAK